MGNGELSKASVAEMTCSDLFFFSFFFFYFKFGIHMADGSEREDSQMLEGDNNDLN